LAVSWNLQLPQEKYFSSKKLKNWIPFCFNEF
jgi:hypothetical protein